MERISVRCSQGFNSATMVVFSFVVEIKVTTTTTTMAVVTAAVTAIIAITIPSSIIKFAGYFLENWFAYSDLH